jgi:hypothetical protein
MPDEAVAASVACEPVLRVAGSGVESVTAIGGLVTTFTVAVADFVGSVVDFAVIVIVPPTGTVELFWKVAVAPLEVWLEIVPQLDVLQLSVQFTPAAAVSFKTIAVNVAERAAPVCST